MAQIEARIDPEWATRVASQHIDIWEHNPTYIARYINTFDIGNLGGLVLPFSGDLYNADQAREIERGRGLVNLAFSDLGRITVVNEIFQPLRTAGRDKNEFDKWREHWRAFPDQAWLFPDSALEIVPQSAQV